MSQPSVPSSPDPAKTYEKEIQLYLQNNPQLLQAEQDARAQYDPQRIAEQQGLQAYFGPTQYQQQLDARSQLDPYGVQVRDQLGQSVSNDLASGYALPKDFSQQLDTQIRGAQTARGNVLGNAPVSAEGAFKGKAAIDLYQQHLDNAGQFLGLSTPEQQIQAITPVAADRSSAYVNPNAGFLGQQLGVANYGNQLGQYSAQNAQGNPWARALSGAAQGAAAGGGGWGSVIGAGAGAAGGYFSSDRRLKKDIKLVGQSPTGHNIYEFRYSGDPDSGKYQGVMADEVLQIQPEAVGVDDQGYYCVDYGQLDVRFEVVEEQLGLV